MINKVLINIRQLQFRYTGVQSYIYNLTKSLIKLYPQIKFELATFNYNGGNQFIDDLGSFKNTKIINTNSFSGAFFDIVFDHLLVSRVISDHNIYFNPVNITPLSKNKKTKYIVGVLDLCTFIVPETTTRSLRLYYQIFLKRSLVSADAIIAISKSTKKDIINIFKVDQSKISVVYLGIDDDITPVNSRKGQEEYLFMMATSRRKNINKILEGYMIFQKKYPGIKAKILINNDYMAKEVSEKIRELGIPHNSVEIISRYTTKKTLSSLYQNAVSFIYCPVYEGFGLPVLEGMKCGCPVITSNTSSMPEITGNSAIAVDPHSPQKIAEAIEKIFTHPKLRSKMILRGKTNADNYSWRNSAKSLYEFFQKTYE